MVRPEGKRQLAKPRRRLKADVKNGSRISWMGTWNGLMRLRVVTGGGLL